MKRKKAEHLGSKLKRFRLFRGMTQMELADSIGKARSLISLLERTGNINEYTLKDIAKALSTSPEEIENFPEPNAILEEPVAFYKELEHLKQTIEQQRAEIESLKDTINKQWELIKNLTKGKR